MNFSEMFFSHAEEKARVEGLAGADFCLWLKPEVAAARIDFCYALNTGHPDANVGFPLIISGVHPTAEVPSDTAFW